MCLPCPALPCLLQLAARHSVEPGLRLWVADSGHAAYMGVFCAFVALFALLQLSRLPLPLPLLLSHPLCPCQCPPPFAGPAACLFFCGSQRNLRLLVNVATARSSLSHSLVCVCVCVN